jgi:Tol biopolymer transport system component
LKFKISIHRFEKGRAFFLFVLGLLFYYTGCSRKPPIEPRQVENIFFLSNREAPKRQFHIFRASLDGTQQTNLTSDETGIRSISRPMISPDGSELIFIHFTGGRTKLRKMTIDGKNYSDLTELKTDNPDAQFTPDNEYIIFVDRSGDRLMHQIHIINRDGSNRRNLSNNRFDEKDPAISPDGKKIVFSAKRGKTYRLYSMNLDGSRRKMLTDDSGNDRNPSFSPDGSKVVFDSDRNGNSDVYMIRSRGGQLFPITQARTNDSDPVFSPDGKHLIFGSNVRGMRYRDLLLYEIRSKRWTNLTDNLNHFNQNLVFTPDGKRIYFESVKFQDCEIYTIDVDTREIKNISNYEKWDCCPTL